MTASCYCMLVCSVKHFTKHFIILLFKFENNIGVEKKDKSIKLRQCFCFFSEKENNPCFKLI